jgi:hypothetical protein
VSARSRDLARSYTAAFGQYLASGGEDALRAAYELGREAVAAEIGILDLAFIHHDALASALSDASMRRDAGRVTQAGAAFFVESVSAFEMVRRGFKEARDAAALERGQAGMLRQLSRLLADASLAVDASRSLREVLLLVAEGTRELVAARACVASATLAGADCVAVACDDSVASASFERAAAIATARLLVHAPEHSIRASEDELRNLSIACLEGGWVGAALTALDGRLLGSIQVFGESGFSAVDEAIVMHVAHMTAAAVERSARYGA